MKLAGVITPPGAAYRGRLAAWWNERTGRERLLLTMLGLLLALFVLVRLVIVPLAEMNVRARQDIAAFDQLQGRVRALGPAFGPHPVAAGDLAADARSRAVALGLTVTGATPRGQATEFVLPGASYETLVAWLRDVTRNGGARIERMALHAATAPGTVDAIVALSR